MQKIGLIELAHHNEVLRAYLIVLCYDINRSVTVYTNEWVYDQCYDLQENEQINWIIKPTHISDQKFLDLQFPAINEHNLVIQTTIENVNGEILRPKTSSPLALVIHDLHSQFKPLSNLNINYSFPEVFKEIFRLAKFFFKQPILKKALNKSDFWLVPSEHVLDYAQSKLEIYDKLVYFPFAVNDEISKIQNHKKIRITVPGIISNKSRNYIELTSAFAMLSASDKVELVLLGTHNSKYGRMIVDQFNHISNLNLLTFDDFIPQQQFDQIMRETDFLIIPMNKTMKFGIIGEKNGFSCTSGNINDMVRFGIPSIVPFSYPLHFSLLDICEQYENAGDLARIIQEWIDTKKFDLIKREKLTEALHSFSKAEFSKLFDHNFTSKNLKKL